MVVQGRPCVRVDRRQLFPSLFYSAAAIGDLLYCCYVVNIY
jgi:hypothetical protein